jgi:hypothetical protein
MKILYAESQESCPNCQNFSVTNEPIYKNLIFNRVPTHIRKSCKHCSWVQILKFKTVSITEEILEHLKL